MMRMFLFPMKSSIRRKRTKEKRARKNKHCLEMKRMLRFFRRRVCLLRS